jgi:hypothetical protein
VRAFWSVKYAGGGEGAVSRHFGERSLNPPLFHSNSISYESWHIQLKFDTHLRLLRLKLRSREVAEVARVQVKKKFDQKFWNLQFLRYTNIIHLKRKLRTINRHSDDFVMKKLKKNWFWDFRSQKIITFHRSWLNFWKTCQDSKKMTSLPSSWDVYG